MKYAPSLLVGAGIIAATILALYTKDSGWWVMGGPALLALTVVGADALQRGERPSSAAWLLAAALILASAILALADPLQVAMMLPILSGGAWAVLVSGRLVGDRTDARC